MSLLDDEAWWISTARVFVPLRSRPAGTSNARNTSSSDAFPAARVVWVKAPAGMLLRTTSAPFK